MQYKKLQEAKLLSLNNIPTKPGIKTGEILYNKITLIIILGPYHYTSIFSTKTLFSHHNLWFYHQLVNGRLLGVSVYSHSWLSQVFTL